MATTTDDPTRSTCVQLVDLHDDVMRLLFTHHRPRPRGTADSDAASSGGLTRWSAEPYLQSLRRMMIVDEVEGWSPVMRSRSRPIIVPKRHLVDPSLAAGLLDASPA